MLWIYSYNDTYKMNMVSITSERNALMQVGILNHSLAYVGIVH